MSSNTGEWKKQTLPLVVKREPEAVLNQAWSDSRADATQWPCFAGDDVTQRYVNGRVEMLGFGAFGLVFKAATKRRPKELLAVKMVFNGTQTELGTAPMWELRALLYLRRIGSCDNNLICYQDHFRATLGPAFIAAVDAYAPKLRARRDSFGAASTGYFIETVFLGGRTMAEDVIATDLTRELRTYAQVLRIIADLVKALAFMHENLLAHLDITPGNVMLLNSGTDAVLLDVGLACRPTPGDHTHGACLSERQGTTFYFAPTRALGAYHESPYKVMTRELYFSYDVYGLGLTLYDWGRGFIAYRDKMTLTQARAPAQHPGGRLPMPPYWPAEQDSEERSLNMLLEEMLRYDDTARITAPQALAMCSRFIKTYLEASGNPDSDTPVRHSLRQRLRPGGVNLDQRPVPASPSKPRHDGTYILDEPPAPHTPVVVYGSLPQSSSSTTPTKEPQKRRRVESTDVDVDASDND